MPSVDDVFRLYDPAEVGRDGYPPEWHRLPIDSPALDAADLVLPGGVKDVVRALAGHRCERCGHPFIVGSSSAEWSPCDERCTHRGPIRLNAGTPFDGKPGEFLGPQGARAVEAAWRVLTVHHLNGVKWDLRWWNLAALCQRCHLTIQGRVVMERVYPWEHTPWFRPHAAGWYASAYLGEDLTRAETLERLEELLALERQA